LFPWVLFVLILFFLAWAGDGVDSTLDTLRIIPPLYPPQNILRLATGALMGITLGSLIFILFNSLVWRDVRPDVILARPLELGILLGLQALLVLAVASGWGLLLIPLTLASLIAILVLNIGLMSAMAASLMRRLANNWRQAWPPLVAGGLIALFYLDGLAFGRVLLNQWLGLPL